MSIGTSLRTYVESTGKDQQVLAIEWHEKMGNRLSPPVKLSTVEQRFSQLLGDHDKGFRFFFHADRTRAATLFEVLGVPEEGRMVLLEQSERLARTGSDRPLAWIIDVSDWPDDRESCDRWFLALEREVLPRMLPGPVALLVTDDQYRFLPRTFDDLSDNLRVVRVDNALAAQEQVSNLAEEGTLRVGRYSSGELDRWLAMEWEGERILFHPDGGLEHGRREGVVERLEGVCHPLDELVGDVQEPEGAELGPIALRQLLVDLADPERTAAVGAPEVRLWWSRQYDVPATSTAAERRERAIQMLVAQLGLAVESATEEKLQHRLERAARRPVSACLLRVGDVLHAINPSPEVEPEPPLLEVHRIACAVPALTRLREAVADWTTDDADDDRFLENVIERLDPDGKERRLFHHARATMLVNGELQPREPARDGDWKEALTALLAGGPPAAELQILEPPEAMGSVNRDGAILVVPQERRWWSTTGRPQIDDLPPVGDPVLKRDHDLGVLHHAECSAEQEDWVRVWSPWRASRAGGDSEDDRVVHHFEEPNRNGSEPGRRSPYVQWWEERYPRTFLPLSTEPVAEGAWLDAVEASVDFGASADAVVRFASREGAQYRKATPSYDPLIPTQIQVPDSVWHEADRLVAMIWLALRQALLRRTCATLHDGTVLLPLQAGIVAELHPRRYGGGDSPIRAMVKQSVLVESNRYYSSCSGKLLPLTVCTPVWTGTSAGYPTNIGPQLPRGIRLSGCGFRVDVVFSTSPFFADGLPDPMALGSVAGGGLVD